MRRVVLPLALVMLTLGLVCCGPAQTPALPTAPIEVAAGQVALPTPALAGSMSLEEALARRRSVREFDDTPLSMAEVGQLLWAAQGITNERGFRTAPSAGALYPLEMYLVTAAGVFYYEPNEHRLLLVRSGDVRPDLYGAALRQEPVRQAPALFVVAAVYERTAEKYGPERSPRYVHLEAGHAAQNLLLQATALGLGAVPIGAFDDKGVQAALGLPANRAPLYLIPVGHPAGAGQ